MEETFSYVGGELEVFAHAQRWKAYWTSSIRRWVKGDVLEVGAGLGANTAGLQGPHITSWLCLEPDPKLVARLAKAVAEIPHCSVQSGTVANLPGGEFDSILYIDVLEHVQADRKELEQAARLLRLGGHLIVLAPAHQFLYTEFDAAIGHYRRYNKASLRACTPVNCVIEATFYLDSMGVLASLANRVLLRQSNPTVRQIKTWDNVIIPLSRVLDRACGHQIGKTIVCAWTSIGNLPASTHVGKTRDTTTR